MVSPRRKEQAMHIRGYAGAALAALALPLALVACGGDGGADAQVASIARTTTEETERASQASEDPEEAMLAFARCMREQGADVPDPQDGRFRFRPRGDGTPSEAERRDFQEAEAKCRPLLRNLRPPQLSEEDRAALQDALLAFARCMRERGVDMPDPDFSGGGGAFRIGPGGVDPTDPDFREAQRECRRHLQPLEERLERGRDGS
jgi:hypothetical protein